MESICEIKKSLYENEKLPFEKEWYSNMKAKQDKSGFSCNQHFELL